MKILVIQDYLRSGGTERQSILLARAFVAAGHETVLLTFRPGGALADTAAGVTHSSLQRFDLRLDWFAPGLGTFIRRFQPDVVLCMGRMANCYAGGIQRRFPRVAVIATMRTGKPLPRLFRRSLQLVRHIVANSRDARETLIVGHHVAPERISVIHNSLVFPPVAALRRNDSLRAHFGANSQTTILLCVAMFRPEKNQRELIEIVSGLPAQTDWQLWLAGEGRARPDCERLAATKNLYGRVRFLGFHRDPAPLYAAADIAVHASWSESLSNFLIESQAHGLPAVAYRAQGVRESFIPDLTGWEIARDDRGGFRAALLRLMAESNDARTNRTTAACTFARTSFDPARQVASYIELFRTLGHRATP